MDARRQRRDEEEEPRRRPTRDEIVPGREERRSGGGVSNLVRGSVLGLILGAGGVLAAYFGGAMPNRGPEMTPQPGTDNSAALAQLKQDADTAKKDAADAKASEKNHSGLAHPSRPRSGKASRWHQGDHGRPGGQ